MRNRPPKQTPETYHETDPRNRPLRQTSRPGSLILRHTHMYMCVSTSTFGFTFTHTLRRIYRYVYIYISIFRLFAFAYVLTDLILSRLHIRLYDYIIRYYAIFLFILCYSTSFYHVLPCYIILSNTMFDCLILTYYIALNLCTTDILICIYTFIVGCAYAHYAPITYFRTLPDSSEVGDVLGRSIAGPVGRCIGPSRLWILVLLCHDVGRFWLLRPESNPIAELEL